MCLCRCFSLRCRDELEEDDDNEFTEVEYRPIDGDKSLALREFLLSLADLAGDSTATYRLLFGCDGDGDLNHGKTVKLNVSNCKEMVSS